MNYFSLYNLPEQFEVDLELLKQHYQTLQKVTHPDRFASASDQQKRIYLQKNTQVNDAYSVLKSPVKRGEHLLELRGLELVSEQETVGDVNFLMQQMEWREKLEEATDASQLQELDTHIDQQINAQNTHLTELLSANTEQQNQQAAEVLRQMKFMYKLASEIHRKLDSYDN